MRPPRPLIVGYHGIDVVDARHDPIRLYVDPEAFVAQVGKLRKRGYEFVTMSEFADRLAVTGAPPRGVVALTFDDGTTDHAQVLPPLLHDLGVPGTIFVCPGLADAPYPWAAEEAGRRFMSLAEITELAADPLIEIGAHTNEHHELHEADAETAFREMSECKLTLEELTGVEVVSFCYPRCHYSLAAREAAPRAGYKSAVACGLLGSWHPYELRREVMHTADGPMVTDLRLRGRYSGLGTSLPARGLRQLARSGDRVTQIRTPALAAPALGASLADVPWLPV